MDNILKLGSLCYLEYTTHSGVALCYTERSPDHWYGDTETEIDINPKQAAEIVAWLCEKYQLPNAEADLLACPFCGSDNVEIVETDSGVGGLHGEYYGTCWGCYAETSKENTRRKARQAWNRRHANAPHKPARGKGA